MIANSNFIDRKPVSQKCVDLFNGFPAEPTAGNLRLVCDHDEHETMPVQSLARLGNPGRYLELIQPRWRVGQPIP
jgi:hypothetical protein